MGPGRPAGAEHITYNSTDELGWRRVSDDDVTRTYYPDTSYARFNIRVILFLYVSPPRQLSSSSTPVPSVIHYCWVYYRFVDVFFFRLWWPFSRHTEVTEYNTLARTMKSTVRVRIIHKRLPVLCYQGRRYKFFSGDRNKRFADRSLRADYILNDARHI